MLNDRTYDIGKISQIINDASTFFDVVRLVDPISMTVYSVENGELHAQFDSCAHVWNKSKRCENCISSRCIADGQRYSKFEFIDKDIYHVVAQRIMVGEKPYVLEVVTASNDNVLLSAFGNNAFVDKINSFNRKVYTDELTGLSNRRFLDERFGILLDRAKYDGMSVSSVMVDIDDFKEVNDSQGHLAGDALLKAAGRVLNQAFRPDEDDILARYGGDEFFVALRGLSREELKLRLDNLLSIAKEHQLGVTFSVGAYYQNPVHTLDAKKCILHADRAMYSIKASSKNGYSIAE